MRFSYVLLILVLFLQFVFSGFCGDSLGGILYNFNQRDTNTYFTGITFNVESSLRNEKDYFSFPSTQLDNAVVDCCGNDLYIRRYFPENELNKQKQIFKIPFLQKNLFKISSYAENKKSCVGNDFYFTRLSDDLLCKSVSSSVANVSCANPTDWSGFSLNDVCNIVYDGCDNQKIFSATCDSSSSISKGRYSECGGDMYFFSQHGLMKSLQGEPSFEKLSDLNFYYSKAFCNNLSGNNDFYITDKDNNLFKSIEGQYNLNKLNSYSSGGYFGGDDFYWQSASGVYKSIGGSLESYKISTSSTAFSKKFYQFYSMNAGSSCSVGELPLFYVNPVNYTFFWAEDNGNIIRSSKLGASESKLVFSFSSPWENVTSPRIAVEFAKEYTFFWLYSRADGYTTTYYHLVKSNGVHSGTWSADSSTTLTASTNLNRISADYYYYQNLNGYWFKIPGDSFNLTGLFYNLSNPPELVNNSYTSNGFRKVFSNYDSHGASDLSPTDYFLFYRPTSSNYLLYRRTIDNKDLSINIICSDSYFVERNSDLAFVSSFKINSSNTLVELPLDTNYGAFCGPNYYWRLKNASGQLTNTILASFEGQASYHTLGDYNNITNTYCALSKYFLFADSSKNLHLISTPEKKVIVCSNISDLTKISILQNGVIVCDSSSQKQIHSIKKFEKNESTLISNYEKFYGFCGDEFFYIGKIKDLNYLYSYNSKTDSLYLLGEIDNSQTVFCKENTVRWGYQGNFKYKFLQDNSLITSSINYILSSDGFVTTKESSNFISTKNSVAEKSYSHVLNCSDWSGFSKPQCVGTFSNAKKADHPIEITLNSKNSGLVEKNTRPLCGNSPYLSSCNNAYLDTKGICEFTCNYGYHKVGSLCIKNSLIGPLERICGNGIIEVGEDCSNCVSDVKCLPGQNCMKGVCGGLNEISKFNLFIENKKLYASLKCLFSTQANLNIFENEILINSANSDCNATESIVLLGDINSNNTNYHVTAKINPLCDVCTKEDFIYAQKETQANIPDWSMISLVFVVFIVAFILIKRE